MDALTDKQRLAELSGAYVDVSRYGRYQQDWGSADEIIDDIKWRRRKLVVEQSLCGDDDGHFDWCAQVIDEYDHEIERWESGSAGVAHLWRYR